MRSILICLDKTIGFFEKTNQRNSHSAKNHLHLMIFKSMLRATNEKKYKKQQIIYAFEVI